MVKNGDRLLLGDHVLMCGDSTIKKDVEKLVGDSTPNMVFSDPPFDMDYQDVKKAFEHFKDTMTIFILNDTLMAELVLDYRDKFYSTFILIAKNSLLRNNRQPIVSHCMMPCFNFKQSKRDLMQVYTTVEAGRDLYSAGKGARHAKSEKTYVQFFENWLNDGDIVLDLFGHSGSSMMCAEKLNKRCFVMEKDPKYCEFIINRYCRITKTKLDDVLNGKTKKKSQQINFDLN